MTMRAVQAQVAGAPFVLTELPVPEPKPNQVRIKVHACGVCAGEAIPRNALFGTRLPRVPGHEVTGVVDAVGEAVTVWRPGDRVGVGWSGGVDFTCEYCRRGDFTNCEMRTITGSSFDGGYAEYTVAPQDAVAALPDELDFAEAAPLMCAGMTAFNGLRHSTAGPGDLVAVSGVGGVGHLAVAFANAMGFRTVAINRGTAKEEMARQLGAHDYIDSTAHDAGEALRAMGGAQVIYDTTSRGDVQTGLIKGLKHSGQLIVVEGADPIGGTGHDLSWWRLHIDGWYSGVARDSEDALNFAVLKNVRPIIETHKLEDAEQAYSNIGKAHMRSVLLP
ncbi:alcohol dehydrogenase catalytic domain-containing protein [Actinoplanes sp. Pm04-4]|uniref:alcohol dehydrogenase n=1 Tax=Paractinoplanes pyxinae TaxID=2997416 RepID=A0ABT4ASA5_9ACTN|nr:alcohol dehydrogenase catalytic domain-containing protein [Actinoplanes pyxinae]MCY1136707.1 alcohol dehydrogenase catalytic domain-containing protein [Actinoplanes pyxinae]